MKQPIAGYHQDDENHWVAELACGHFQHVVCSPSRTAVMTGHFPARYNIDGHFAWVPNNAKRNMPDWLDPQVPTLPRFLQQAGYATAHFGKWHLSNNMIPDSPLPIVYGYDEYGAFNCAGEQMPVHEDSEHAKVKPGTQNSDIVSPLDFTETFLDIAGVDVPNDMQGKSLVPILTGNTPNDWRESHYYEYFEGGGHGVSKHYAVCTKQHKLIHFKDKNVDQWELVDLKADPLETKNFYDDSSYASVRKQLHEELTKLRNKYQVKVTGR